MASLRQKSGMKNVTPLRRKLRNMHKVIENDVKPEIEQKSQLLAQTMGDNLEKVLLPTHTSEGRKRKRTGALKKEINYKISSDGLAAVIGPAAKTAAVIRRMRGSIFATRNSDAKPLGKLTKKRLMQLFKALWIEFGTKGSKEHNIPPMKARPFLRPAWEMVRGEMIKGISQAVNNTLRRVDEL